MTTIIKLSVSDIQEMVIRGIADVPNNAIVSICDEHGINVIDGYVYITYDSKVMDSYLRLS